LFEGWGGENDVVEKQTKKQAGHQNNRST